jgi:hypothetical protein
MIVSRMSDLIAHPSRRSRLLASSVSALLAGLLLSASAAAAQTRTTIRDRVAQDKERETGKLGALGVIDGVVTDTILQPLGSADVSVVGAGARVVTGENGRFRMLQVPPGQYLLVVRRVGFSPTSGIIEVPAGDTLRLAYTLTRSGNMLDTVRVKERRVTLRMLEFEQRRVQGVGQFITREDIERRGSLQTSDFLRYMRGVEVSNVTTGAFAGTQIYSRREGGGFTDAGQQQYCPMQVILDGIILPKNFNLELLPPPKQIGGIEVYTGAATAPLSFGGPDRRCGVVAIWTRDGY